MKDKPDYESVRLELAKAGNTKPSGGHSFQDELRIKEFIHGADFSRRFCYTEDKVIGEMVNILRGCHDHNCILRDKTKSSVGTNGRCHCKDNAKQILALFAEEKKKWVK